MKKFIHSGRAANCKCKGMTGARCPDCNHVLTGKAVMIQGGEMEGVEHQEVRCEVCGRVVTSQSYNDIALDVQDSTGEQTGEM